MPACAKCGSQTGYLDIKDGKCGGCRGRERDEAQAAKRAEAEAMRASQQAEADAAKKAATLILLTTESAPALPISQRLGLVSGERIFGLNILKDLFAEVRDIVGGRSATLEKAMQDARQDAIDAMTMKAVNLGADAVVGISLTHSEMTGVPGGGGMVMVVATGTAVKLARP